MDKVQKENNSNSDTPSSEPYIIAKRIILQVFTAVHSETNFWDCGAVVLQMTTVLQEHAAFTFRVDGGIYKTAHWYSTDLH
jgi:hypothetical protein